MKDQSNITPDELINIIGSNIELIFNTNRVISAKINDTTGVTVTNDKITIFYNLEAIYSIILCDLSINSSVENLTSEQLIEFTKGYLDTINFYIKDERIINARRKLDEPRILT